MKINDGDFKEMVCKIDNINTKVEVIVSQITNIESHLKTQDVNLKDHETNISSLRVKTEGLNSKMWVFLFIGGIIGSAVMGIYFGILKV